MSSPGTIRAYRARYVVPIVGPPIADGVVSVREGRIVAVGENASGAAPVDLGNVALLPALVNPHVHLEFSGLERPLAPVDGRGFAAWIRSVVAWRRAWRAECRDDAEAQARRRADVEAGLRETRRAGTALVGEIATPGWPRGAFESGDAGAAADPATYAADSNEREFAAPAATVFYELLGLASGRRGELLQAAADHVAAASDATVWRAGVSPHAPYTAGLELVREVARRSGAEGWPVAMHLAESAEELELLRSHSGPLVEMLVDWNVWDASAVPRGLRPLDYLEALAEARRALVIHGNFLFDDDWRFLAERRERMTVVYCPRTHDGFGHGAYPLEEMLAAGVAVAVGTDSRASNPDLDSWAELRFVRRRYPRLAPRAILELGTLRAAEALGRADEFGAIAPGRRAEFALASLGDLPPSSDVEERLLAEAPSVRPWSA